MATRALALALSLATLSIAHAQDATPPSTSTPQAPATTPPTTAATRTTPAARTPAAPTPRQQLVAREKVAKEKLASSDPAAIAQALDVFAELGGEAAAAAIGARLRQGLPPLLIEQAIDVLVAINKSSVGPVLLELTLHRRATVRQRAVMAIGVLKIRSAQSALLYCLDDPSPDVRSAAVFALGDVGDQRALQALLSAADHGADKALESVGKIARPQNLKLIFERARGGEVTLVKPALQVLMDRADFPLAGKLEIIKTLATLRSVSARALLVQWLEALKTSGHPRVRKALFDAIKQVDQAVPQDVSSRTSTTTVTTEAPPSPAATTATPVLPAPLPKPKPATASPPATAPTPSTPPSPAAPAPAAPNPAAPSAPSVTAPLSAPNPAAPSAPSVSAPSVTAPTPPTPPVAPKPPAAPTTQPAQVTP